ncbi:MAG TPA: succinyl-diaminopimelate desuccinylase [Planctomycetota bacterium]|nr:succinyl-diaminopimelate desuccinylase [Planctomycetota bacterium]
MRERLLALLAIRSVVGEEAEIAGFVEAELRRRLPDVRRHGNAVAAFGPRRGKPLVALVGHLDTVAAAPDDANPPRVERDRVHGLGSSDMKGAIACDLELAATIELERSPFDLAWVLYDREEGPVAENGLLPLVAAAPELRAIDLAICGEPTDNAIQLGCLGSVHARVTYRGRAAHSARPWQGRNAIHAGAPLLAALAAREPRDVRIDGLVYREVVGATLARGGRSRNVVPDAFELNVNARFAPERSFDDVERELRELAGPDAEIDVLDRAPAAPPRRSHPLVEGLVASTRAAVEPKQAWTDVAQLSALGIAAVNFGPGEQAQAHQRGESVSVAALERGLELRRRFLAR